MSDDTSDEMDVQVPYDPTAQRSLLNGSSDDDVPLYPPPATHRMVNETQPHLAVVDCERSDREFSPVPEEWDWKHEPFSDDEPADPRVVPAPRGDATPPPDAGYAQFTRDRRSSSEEEDLSRFVFADAHFDQDSYDECCGAN